MYYREFYYWCREAVSSIKYIPDKNKVYNELFDHLLDRYESFVVRGMSEEIAVKKTLEAMGDPKELSPQLAAIHKPYWAYALHFTRFVALVLLALLIGRGVIFFHDQNYYTKDPLGDPFSESSANRISYITPDVKVSADGYTFRVTEAGVWDYGAVVRIKVTNPIPWSLEQTAVMYMEAKDNFGRRYICDTQRGSKTQNYVVVHSERKGLTTYWYDLYLYGVSENIQWLELCYNRDGRNLFLHLDFSGGD